MISSNVYTIADSSAEGGRERERESPDKIQYRSTDVIHFLVACLYTYLLTNILFKKLLHRFVDKSV